MAPMRLMHIWNISTLLVTWLVTNLSLTKMVVRALQPMNIYLISVTFAVLKLVRSSEVRAEHLSNIEFIFVTFSVLRCSMPSISVRFVNLQNQ